MRTCVIKSPTVVDSSTFQPSSPSPVTIAQVVAFGDEIQTVTSTPTTVLTIPLPGTSGAPNSTGGIWIDAIVESESTSSTDGAIYKMSWGWSVQTRGSPLAKGTLLSLLSTGTNGSAPPAGWAATMTLDGGSVNAIIVVTGGGLTVSHVARAEVRYIQ